MDNDSDSDTETLNILNDLMRENSERNEDEIKNQSTNEKETEEEKIPQRTLKELDFNFLDCSPINDCEKKSNSESNIQKNNVSEIHDNKLDSSDDEDQRYFEEQKYSEYGRDIKTLLKKQTSEKEDNYRERTATKDNKSLNLSQTSNNKNSKKLVTTDSTTVKKDFYSDPCFGIRIVTPLISSTELKDRMGDKIAVTVSKIKYHLNSEKTDNDWVIAGVLISKTATKKSQKGSSYCIWKISDLSENINTVAVFLFSGAYKTFWKTTLGSVVGILNPGILESKDNNDLATLSVNQPQKIMILGKSKDMGKCKSIKKNGEPCSSIVNLSRCEFCVYHVKQEYKKCSRRVELQTSNPLQRFSSDKLNKPKSLQSGMYNQGMQQFVPVPAKRNEKLYQKDQERLALLSGSKNTESKNASIGRNDVEPKIKAFSVELTTNQAKKDLERLNKMRGWKNSTQVVEVPQKMSDSPKTLSKSNTSIPPKISHNTTDVKKTSLNNFPSLTSVPKLGAGCNNGTIDLSQSINKKHFNAAKMNAVKWVQEKGAIKRIDPNKIRLSKEERLKKGVKRQRETETQANEEQVAKKAAVVSDRFKELLETKSSHTDLIEKCYEKEKEEYFNKLEIKERMEEKMMTTFKVDCKAVKCLICKYTAFSASDICKEKNHPLRVLDAVKRFFKCSDCGNRTVSLDRIPSLSCKKCSGSSWVRAPMMDEKKITLAGPSLCVRGDEEKFVGSLTTKANLGLLVPETD